MRLIDADMLRAEFNNNTLWHYTGIRAKIDGAPTAYDIDKVIKQLEKVSFVDVDEEYADDGQKMLFLHDAIEIVKKGDVE